MHTTLGHAMQWRSQKAEKITHIKGRLLGQAVIPFICVNSYAK